MESQLSRRANNFEESQLYITDTYSHTAHGRQLTMYIRTFNAAAPLQANRQDWIPPLENKRGEQSVHPVIIIHAIHTWIYTNSHPCKESQLSRRANNFEESQLYITDTYSHTAHGRQLTMYIRTFNAAAPLQANRQDWIPPLENKRGEQSVHPVIIIHVIHTWIYTNSHPCKVF